MARPQKKGLDYFNLDCVQDDNLTFIEAKHGIEGFGIVVKLWQRIYRHDGYFMPWNEQSMYLFARDIGVNIDVIISVVNTCLLPSISIFSQELLDSHKVLTSSGIQKRWQTVVKLSKRKNTEIDKKYNLLELAREETELTREETELTREESTQSKGKESTLNENINDIPELETRDPLPLSKDSIKADFFIKIFNETKGTLKNPTKYKMNNKLTKTLIERLKDGYTSKDFIKAIKNCKADQFHIENNMKHLTPEFILRPNILEKYLNAPEESAIVAGQLTNAEKRKLGLIPQLK